jgi:hypothetical protein
VADGDANAHEDLIDRLLASPHYGERWARHWLDLARYADTKGYVYEDREDPRFLHSHVYRDWVIRALNEDLPYDRFLLLQIAADQVDCRREDLAAMGFLTLGRRFLGVVHDIIDDRIDVVMRSTQALSVGCARCHDHKYDPISMRDYYALYGVFRGSTEKTVSLETAPASGEAHAAFAGELTKRVAKLESTFHARREEYAARIRAQTAMYLLAVLKAEEIHSEEFYTIRGPEEVNPVFVRQWQAWLFESGKVLHPVLAPWHAFASLPAREFQARAGEAWARLQRENPARLNGVVARAFAAFTPSSMEEVARKYGEVFRAVNEKWLAVLKADAPPGTLPDTAEEEVRQVLYAPGSPCEVPPGAIVDSEWFFDEAARIELAKLQKEIEAWIIEGSGAPPHAVILEDRATQRNPRVFQRGNPKLPGEEVHRRFLTALSGPEPREFVQGSGRLELARAIADPANPLTARVIVNRVWFHHFGAGLVKTPSDFGARCEPPSHPEILDYLALWFMDQGWSLKKLHRLIMTSSVYRQEGGGGSATDPENALLARANRGRLDFEALRDSLLAVTGELDPTRGGTAVDLFQKPFARRRAVYGRVDRSDLPAVLRTFDFANPDIHIPARHYTTVPQQALFFLNSDFVAERARALAGRDDVRSLGGREKIERLHHLVYQRAAEPSEVERGLRFIAAAEKEPPLVPRPPPRPVWQYGYGEVDEAPLAVKAFAPLLHFTGQAWQGGAAWPDERLGWVQVTAQGGHAGNDRRHASVRRWVAPRDQVVSIAGTLEHTPREGDGVRGSIFAGDRLLATWNVHAAKVETRFEPVAVKAGEAIDFAVDCRSTVDHDMFQWTPVLKTVHPASAAPEEAMEWNAGKQFAGPPEQPPVPLATWEKYAQVLLLANEFLFID